ncbi:type III restriction enzyme [Methanocalculus sp. MC3]
MKFSFACHMFGLNKLSDFQVLLAKIEEGEDEDGQSYFYHVLKRHDGFRENARITHDELQNYDENIVRYMKQINHNRDTPIRLKYYQWLAALFTEVYLDLYFQSPGKLAARIEDVVKNHVKERLRTIEEPYEYYARFTPNIDELRKCAFWMATGSGKTFLIHLAYLQFQHYNKGPNKLDIERVLLITPNTDLSAQHIREMKISNIPCTQFDPERLSGYFQPQSEEAINVIEITRFTEDKKDGGLKRVDIENFGKKNLIFVDEAHKGSGGEKWKKFRQEVSREGFTFEYSATFGQAAAGGGSVDNDNLSVFAKTILFDYSYPHFYNDGYGKEYRILNVNKSTYETDKVLFANLLTYYEQKLVFEDLKEVATTEYNIADPLWIFVGSTVNVSSTKSDVLTVVRFFKRVLTDRDWVIKTIDAFVQGRSGLLHEKTKHDLFSPAYPEQRLRYLREKGLNPDAIYSDMLHRIFRCSEASGLTLVHLKNSEGEIGLKSGDNHFFGDIYVGDAPKFIKIVEDNEPHINVEKITHPSLFRSIDSPESTINILIGAKKFIEGWDCYRVSCMGLINIGKSEGTEIIQLFGRGIRLKGHDNSLKRSTNDTGDQPQNLPLLETLNIFGVDAKYIGYLREFLTIEGVDEYKTVERRIPIKITSEHIQNKLLIPHWEKTGFERKQRLVLSKEHIVPVTIDLLPKVEVEDSAFYLGVESDDRPDPIRIDTQYLDLIDWNEVYFTLLNHKNTKGWKNVVFNKDLLRMIIADQNCYTLYCDQNVVRPAKFTEISKLQDVIILIIKKSIQTAYSRLKNIWMMDTIQVERLSESHGNFEFGKYTLKIKENEVDVLEAIDASINEIEQINIGETTNFITNIFFKNHLYQPLLAKTSKSSTKIDSISPEGLNEGEEKLVRSIKVFIDEHPELFSDKKIYLIRNIPKTGVGFYKRSWFYPDFIMWLVDTNTQHIIFLEPHGMVYSAGFDDEKVQLASDIKQIEHRINTRLKEKGIVCGLKLDSFIISVTKPQDGQHSFYTDKQLRKEHHILSIHQSDFVKEIFEFALS